MESRCVCSVPAFRDDHTAIGVGPLTADALVATIGDGREFSHGRQLSTWLGLTPTQHSSEGKTHLGQISCRGDGYLRTLLIQGARSSLQRAKAVQQDQANAEQISIRGLSPRLPFGKVLVAIANKHARQMWAMLTRGQDYDPETWIRHPMVQRPAKRHQTTITV
jgi:transposase